MRPDGSLDTGEETSAEARARARRRRATGPRRQAVTRAAQALPAALALAALVLGLLLRLGAGGVAGAGAGLIVSAIGLDLYARLLGAVVMRERPPVAVLLAILGSPGVLLHALLARRGPLAPEPEAWALLVPILAITGLFAVANL